MEKPTIIIADAHSIYRMGLSGYLRLNGYPHIKEAANGEELMSCIRHSSGSIIVLLDIWMNEIDGTEMIAQILKENPEIRFIILTSQAEEKFALKCIKIKAMGFINKAQPESEILRAIESVRTGTNYFNTNTVRLMANSIQDRDLKNTDLPHLNLSEKERMVFLLLAEGLPNKEISHKLHLAETTISTYKKHIFQKLNVKTPLELAMYASRNKLL